MDYPNGQVPLHLLIEEDGSWFFPGTYRKWCALRDDVKARHGVTLYITPPAHGAGNAYRDLDGQESIRDALGIQASVPGRSSHGGIWTGRTTCRYGLPIWVDGLETGAIDVANWFEIGWNNFVEAAERAGFLADVVVPREQWHLVDLDPWGKSSPATTTDQEDPMPTPENKSSAAVQKLSKGKFHPIRLSGNTHEFAMTGAGQHETGDIIVDLRLRGGPNTGTLGRVRAFFEEKRGEKWVRIKTRMDIEIPATTGQTTFQYADKYDFGGKLPVRARIEVQADHDGVEIIRTDYRKAYWRS